MVNSIDPYVDPSSVPSYLPSVNPYRDPSEQKVGAIQEERWETLEQVKSLENIISSGDIKVDEFAQLHKSYIVKLKYCI